MLWVKLLLVLLCLAQLGAWSWFRYTIHGLVAGIGHDPSVKPRQDLPDIVEEFARRGLNGHAPSPSRVFLRQHCEMELKPGAGWQKMTAVHWIGVTETGFVWNASQHFGPLLMLRVVDSFSAGQGALCARLLGSVPVASATGPIYDRGEAMRYLAELPWAPDAILLNHAIKWRVLESGEIEARLTFTPEDAVVRFTLNAAGDIAEIRADNRPTGEVDGVMQYQSWDGRFFDYGTSGPRRIPRKGEVGYVVDGTYQPYWRGQITEYAIE